MQRLPRHITVPILSYGFKQECEARIYRTLAGWWLLYRTDGQAPGMSLQHCTKDKTVARAWWKAIQKGDHRAAFEAVYPK